MNSDVNFSVQKRGEYLAEHGNPVFLAEILMTNIGNWITRMTVAPSEETPQEAAERMAMLMWYGDVLKYMASTMRTEVYPALGRLKALENEMTEKLKEVSAG